MSSEWRREWPWISLIVIAAAILLALLARASALKEIGHVLGPAVSLISVVLVLFGWRVAYQNSLRVASRAELHSLSALLMEKLDSVDKQGGEFWSQSQARRIEASGLLAGRRFLALLGAVGLIVELLRARGAEIHGFDSDFVALRSSLTLDVEDAGRVSDEKCALKIQRISGAAQRLRRSAYQGFMALHPNAK